MCASMVSNWLFLPNPRYIYCLAGVLKQLCLNLNSSFCHPKSVSLLALPNSIDVLQGLWILSTCDDSPMHERCPITSCCRRKGMKESCRKWLWTENRTSESKIFRHCCIDVEVKGYWTEKVRATMRWMCWKLLHVPRKNPLTICIYLIKEQTLVLLN